MEDDGKIKYSDLIQADDSIERLIQQLEQLQSTYASMLEGVRAGAGKMSQSLKQASGATAEGRTAIEETTAATKRLKKAQEEFEFSLTDTGKAVAELKAKTTENNRATVELERKTRALAGSYDSLAKHLSDSVRQWKSLSSEQRKNDAVGGRLLDIILNIKTQLSELDNSLKPLTDSYAIQRKAMNELATAKARYASLQGKEGAALLESIRETERLTESYRQQLNVETQLARAQARKEQLYTSEYEQLVELRGELSRETKLRELDIQLAKAAPGSYDQLSLQYRRNKIELNAMSAEMRSATEYGKNLEKETLELYKRMVALQEATGNHKLSVGNYTKAWDGLGFSISQVVRELPNAAVGMNTLFLALSNNIPIVIDEIKKLKEANAAAVAAGKPTKSVIGAITSALLSWHTVLIAGITILTNYGDEIWAWTKKMIKGRNAVISLKEALKNIAKELEDNNNSYGDSIVSLKNLQQEWKNLKTTAEKNQWIKDNKSEFDKLGVAVNSVTEADNIFIDNTSAVVEALKLRARATAAQTLAAEKYEDALIKRNEAETEYSNLGSFDETGNFVLSESTKEAIQRENELAKMQGQQVASSFSGYGIAAGGYGTSARAAQVEALAKEALAAEATADAYFDLAAGYEARAKAELEAAGIDSPHKKGSKGRTREIIDLDERINKDRLKIRKRYEQSVTRLEEDTLKQKHLREADSRRAEARELMLQYSFNEKLLKANESAKNGVFELGNKRYKQLTDSQIDIVRKQQDDIRQAILNNNAFIRRETEKEALELQQRELTIQQETIKLRLAAAKKGSKEEINLRVQALYNEYQQALAANQLLPEDQRQSEELLNKSFTSKMLQLLGEMDLEAFDASQKVQQESFNAVEHTEREKTRFMLEQERDRWEYLITLAKQGSLAWSEEQVAAAEAAVKGINNKLDEISGIKGVIGDIADKGLDGMLLSRLGFDDEAIQAFNEATDTIISNLQSIMEAETQLAEAAVEAAQERADSAKSALEAEIEARNKGYANNVALARKEYEQEKKKVASKQRLLEQAKRKQEALDTAMQTTSLITASANIWKAMSGVPIVGPALAMAAIAAMWGSFAAAKVKARQVTASEQEYGEGGLEFLEGGSHASGNDINLYTKNAQGKNMRAEGGEALAIINKRNTRRYRKQLPGIIESLNKGTFEDKYLRAFETGENVMLSIGSSQNSVDLSKLERYTEKISKQGEVQRVSLANGSMLLINKNVRRIVKV